MPLLTNRKGGKISEFNICFRKLGKTPQTKRKQKERIKISTEKTAIEKKAEKGTIKVKADLLKRLIK